VSLATALAVAGCAPKTGFSGFRGDYSQLKRDAFLDNSLAYTNPAKDLKQSNKFILDAGGRSLRARRRRDGDRSRRRFLREASDRGDGRMADFLLGILAGRES